jgi:hypothetical protein
MDSRTEHNNLKQNNTVVGWVERSETQHLLTIIGGCPTILKIKKKPCRLGRTK